MSAEQFWQALVQAQPELQQLEIRTAMERINQLLQPHYPKLAAELQGSDAAGVYTLIFTAHGATEHFEDVMRLTQSAPKLAMFKDIVAFRRRAEMNEFGIAMDNFQLSSKDILVSHYADAGRVGLKLWFAKPIPQDMHDHARNMSFILLDHVIGEYDFAIKIGPVEFADDEPDSANVSLAHFPPLLDQFWREQLGHTAIFPDGDSDWVAFELVSNTDPDDKLLVQRNEAAMALVGRADMLWRLQVEAHLNNKQEYQAVCEFQDQLTSCLSQTQQGVCCQISLQRNIRCMSWQVNDQVAALQQARSLANQLNQQFEHMEIAISSEFDPQWQDYLRWVS